MQYPIDYELFRTWWKKSTFKSQGYQKTYTLKTPKGDVLQADFNFHENLVKLTLKIAAEKGNTYTAVVKKGNLIRERDASNKRSFPVKKKFLPFKDIFSTLPDEDLLVALGGTFQISTVSLGRKQTDETFDKSGDYSYKDILSDETFFSRLKRRFRSESVPKLPLWTRFKQRFWGDLHDSVLGLSIGSAVYFQFFDLTLLGLVLASLGVVSGGMDLQLRKRPPLFTKIFLFLAFGSYFFYTGYTKN